MWWEGKYQSKHLYWSQLDGWIDSRNMFRAYEWHSCVYAPGQPRAGGRVLHQLRQAHPGITQMWHKEQQACGHTHSSSSGLLVLTECMGVSNGLFLYAWLLGFLSPTGHLSILDFQVGASGNCAGIKGDGSFWYERNRFPNQIATNTCSLWKVSHVYMYMCIFALRHKLDIDFNRDGASEGQKGQRFGNVSWCEENMSSFTDQ